MIQDGQVVTIEYTVHLANGRLLDSTGGCGPIVIMYGSGQLFPALEDRLGAMQAGESRRFQIPASEAFGEQDPALVRRMPRTQLPPGLELVVGEDYRLKDGEGRGVRFRLLGIEDDEIVADFNDPNAGQALDATITVVAVREPTAEEVRRGRV